MDARSVTDWDEHYRSVRNNPAKLEVAVASLADMLSHIYRVQGKTPIESRVWVQVPDALKELALHRFQQPIYHAPNSLVTEPVQEKAPVLWTITCLHCGHVRETGPRGSALRSESRLCPECGTGPCRVCGVVFTDECGDDTCPDCWRWCEVCGESIPDDAYSSKTTCSPKCKKARQRKNEKLNAPQR